jgi:hypothetical protein
MSTRILTTATKHRCVCARLLGISIANTFYARQQRTRVFGRAAQVVCDRCKRATLFTDFDSLRL